MHVAKLKVSVMFVTSPLSAFPHYELILWFGGPIYLDSVVGKEVPCKHEVHNLHT